MALVPYWWVGPAGAVAGGPSFAWGGRGMAWDLAAAVMRLCFALGAAGHMSWGIPPLPTPPPEPTVTTGRADRARRLTEDLQGWAPRRREALPPTPLQPRPRPSCNLPLPPRDLPPAFFAYGTWSGRTWTWTRAGARVG